MHVEVMPVQYNELNNESETITSLQMKDRVTKARNMQLNRFNGTKIFSNSQMSNKEIKKYCLLDTNSSAIMESAFNTYRLSGRSYNRILKVARTIADMDSSVDIKENHLLEAISYRGLEKKYWG